MHAFRLRPSTAALITVLGFVAVVGPALAEMPRMIEAASPTEPAVFDLYFPLRDPDQVKALIEAQNTEGSPLYRQWLTPEEFQRRFGPTDKTIAAAKAELATFGLEVTEHQGQRIRAHGTAGAAARALGVGLFHGEFQDGHRALVADRAIRLPSGLAAAGALTPQFSTIPALRPDSRIEKTEPQNASSPVGPYKTSELRQAYDYPAADYLNAHGVTVGVLMSGGVNEGDIETYLKGQEIVGNFYPDIVSTAIDGGLPFDKTTSGETELDIEQIAGMGLGVDIDLYDLSDLTIGAILLGLDQIVADNKVAIVNMSFGEPEVDLLAKNNGGIDQTYQARLLDMLFQQGSAQGMTFVASSGDHGSTPFAGAAQVRTLTTQFPASDPYVTGVGGTNLVTSHSPVSFNSTYVSENAAPDEEITGDLWASGGGISILWPQPSYQTLVPTGSTTRRTVPDLALHMGGCPSTAMAPCGPNRSADFLWLGGEPYNATGTSASAPDIAGLFALRVALVKKRIGLENVDVYRRRAAQLAGKAGAAFRDVKIAGSNGRYKVASPYDMVIGNGTVDGRYFLGVGNMPASGEPGTITNP